jgi:Pentapeptide repeats (8 copies)
MASDQPTQPTPTSYVSAPFLWVNWGCQWIAYLASNLAVFQVLEYAGKLTVLVALITWIADYPERQKEAIRTAWSVVTAKGGGRKDNLEYLADHQADLKGLYGGSGFFADIKLKGRDLRWSDLEDANFENAELDAVNLEGSKLSGTNFKNAKLSGASFRNTLLYPKVTIFSGANIDKADFNDITILDPRVYRSLATARNWKTALFDKDTRRMVECAADDSTASGCELNVPEISQINPVDSTLLAVAIFQSVHCEVANSVKNTIEQGEGTKVNGRSAVAWLNSWGALITVILTVPNGTLSASATAREILTEYYTVPDLYRRAPCTTGIAPRGTTATSLLIKSDLKVQQWLQTNVLASVGEQLNPAPSPNGKSVISHEVKFQMVSNGGPELKPVNSNTISTHHLLITFGPVDPNQKNGGLATAAMSAHFASQIGAAVSTDLKGSARQVSTAP